MPLGTEVELRPGNIVLDGDRGSPPKNWAEPPPKFSAHFYCGQTAGCIKLPFGIEVGFSPADFVLDGYPQQEGGASPIFGPCLLPPNG